MPTKPSARRTLAAMLCFMMLASIPGPAAAQGYPFSQRGTVIQHVALTTISVTYGRPVARGRTLFGKLVPWDSIWHPGADSATRLTFDHDIVIEGKTLPAGQYSLWLIPREQGLWTVIFSHATRVSHIPYPGAARDAMRVDVTPEAASHVETMTIDFPLVLRESAVMRIHWGEVAVPIQLKAPFRPD
ncbi:MAG: DUF2911 domain-containing protein [bacterium]